jgi:hypothetical protein
VALDGVLGIEGSVKGGHLAKCSAIVFGYWEEETRSEQDGE